MYYNKEKNTIKCRKWRQSHKDYYNKCHREYRRKLKSNSTATKVGGDKVIEDKDMNKYLEEEKEVETPEDVPAEEKTPEEV